MADTILGTGGHSIEKKGEVPHGAYTLLEERDNK